MAAVDPLWLGFGGTAFALVVFANGYRLFDQHIDRKMGLFHMVVAPMFIFTMWMALATMNGALS